MTKQQERDEFLSRWMAATMREDDFDNGNASRLVTQRLADARALMSLARLCDQYNELLCSVEMSEAESDRQSARDEKREERARAICAKYGFVLNTGGDPRGYAFKVVFRPMDLDSTPYNTWGGREDGWGVPT